MQPKRCHIPAPLKRKASKSSHPGPHSPRGVALRGLLAPSSICPLSSLREPGTCLQHPAPSHPFCPSPPPGAWAVGSASSCRGQVVALHPLTSPCSRWARQGPASGKAEPRAPNLSAPPVVSTGGGQRKGHEWAACLCPSPNPLPALIMTPPSLLARAWPGCRQLFSFLVSLGTSCGGDQGPCIPHHPPFALTRSCLTHPHSLLGPSTATLGIPFSDLRWCGSPSPGGGTHGWSGAGSVHPRVHLRPPAPTSAG